jgi:capsular polysaccharide biosynthesis protein
MTRYRARCCDSWVVLPEARNFAETKEECWVMLQKQGGYSYPLPQFVLSDEEIPPYAKEKLMRSAVSYGPLYAVRLHDVLLLENNTFITRKGELLVDLQNMNRRRDPLPAADSPTEFYEYELPNDIPYFDGSAAALFFHTACGSHHSHWLVQGLPRLELFEQAQATFESLLVYDTIKAYQFEMLETLGYPREKVFVRQQLEPIRFRELFVLYTWNDFLPAFQSIDRLISAHSPGTSGPERVYISRKDAATVRKFLNEDDVIELVKKYDFEIVNPSALSAAEEVALFRNARLLCGPLGAGLYNSIFTAPGALLWILGDPNYVMDWAPELCGLRGHSHGYYFGNSFFSYEESHLGTHNNWIVNIETFEKQLRQLTGN